jgi:hypothetical protein
MTESFYGGRNPLGIATCEILNPNAKSKAPDTYPELSFYEQFTNNGGSGYGITAARCASK